MELPNEPSVLVLLVATDGAPWLPEALEGLRAQQHRPIDILAVDNASTDGSAELLVEALGAKRVVTLERRAGYGRALAAALKVAADRGAAADAFLLLHDDAALAPGALEAMLDALRGDRVGIVGAKLNEWDRPEVLQDIGQTTDRFGRAVPRVERGELDQGQHEGAHEVLYATSAALLVARKVVEEVGLFDLRYVALRDDLDLCWRARNAGYRTVVTADASARHAAATVRDLRETPVKRRVRYFADRNMIATLIKNYGLPRLLVALPVTIAISLLNVGVFFATGRRAAALQVLEALQWNLVHLPSTLRARFRAQRARKMGDAHTSGLMHHGATRLRAQFERVAELVAPVEATVERPRGTVGFMRAHPAAALMLAGVAIWLLGARTLLVSGQLAGADFAPFPGAGGFFSEFLSGWRGAAAGGAAPATPGLVVLGVLTFLCFGSAWLAQRVLLLGLPVVAALSMFALARALGLRPAAVRMAAAAYALSPLALGVFAAGRLPDLVLVAAAPALVVPLARAAGIATPARWRGIAGSIVLLALTVSLAPWALVFVGFVALVLAAVRPERMAIVRRAGALGGGALVLLFPWSIELFRAGSPIGAGGHGLASPMRELLAFTATTIRPVPLFLGYALAIAAVVGVVWAPPERRKAAAAMGAVGVAGVFAAWAVARGVPWIAPRAGLPLVAAALAAAILAGVGFQAALSALRERHFGIAHVAVGVAGAALLVQLAGSTLWIAGGDRPGFAKVGALAPSFLEGEIAGTNFRVAWIGGSSSAPVVDLTGPGGRTMRGYLARAAGDGADALRRATAAIVGGGTESGGRLLATFGVRYVVVRPDATPDVADAVARQADLAFFQRLENAIVYRNGAALGVATSVQAPGWVTAARGPFDAVGAAEPDPMPADPFSHGRNTLYRGTTRKGSADVVLAEDFHEGWRAEVAGKQVAPSPAYGWATRFEVPKGPATVRIDWSGHGFHRVMIVVQIAIAIAFAATWSRRAARERGER